MEEKNKVIYAQIQIDPIELRVLDDKGFIKLSGFFDYDFGIQLNLTERHYAFGSKGITLQEHSNGYGTLTIEYPNRETYLNVNPYQSITTQLKKEDNLIFNPDGKVFRSEENCRLRKIEQFVNVKVVYGEQ